MTGDLLGDPAGDAQVSVAGLALPRERVFEAAAAMARRVAGAPAVAVHAQPSLATVVAVVGGLLAGVPVVPLAPDGGPDEAGHVLRDSAAPVLVGGPAEQPAAVAALGAAAPEYLQVDLTARGDPPAAAADPSAPGLVLYTSGTTGPPKGAVISRAAVAADLDALAEAWAWTADDVLVHGLPLFHVHGLVLGVLGALRRGCALVHTGTPVPGRYAAAAGTVYFGVPTVWSRVAADPAAARALGRARLLVSGSAPLPAVVAGRLAALVGRPPIERYGMTETLITISQRAGAAPRPGEVGTPLPGVSTRVVDDAGRPVPVGEPGDLEVRGPTLFDGYLGRPGATSEAFTADGWFRTGDVAAVDAVGGHRIVGRASTDLIKSGGYRIGAGEVEEALLGHPAVREAAVVGQPDDDLGQRVVAFVVAEGVPPRDLIAWVAERLSAHKRPREVHVVAALPRNAMGKVVKTALR